MRIVPDRLPLMLRSYRRLSLADQIVVRGRLLWHILGIEASEDASALLGPLGNV